MEDALPDDIEQLKRLLAEQEALNRALQAKLEEREREIDRLLEPPRFSWRGLKQEVQAAILLQFLEALYAFSASTGGMCPMRSSNRRLLNQSTHASVANSTSAWIFQLLRCMTSAL